MKNKTRPRSTPSAFRLTRSAAVSERRRRLSLWNFYRQTEIEQADAEPPRRAMPEPILTEPSSR
jgi:hypothetical protein